MTTGDYWIYVVNTNLADVTAEVSFSVRLANVDEAHGCSLNLMSSARVPAKIGLVVVLMMLCLQSTVGLW